MASGNGSLTISNEIIMTLYWSSVANISGNYSTVTCKIKLWRDSTYNTYDNDDNHAIYFKVNDSTKASDTSVKFYVATASNGKDGYIRDGDDSYTWSFTVNHDTDGTKSFNLKGIFHPAYDVGSYIDGGSNYTVSLTATMDTIPRGSVLSTVPNFTYDSNPNVGNAFSVPCTKYVSSYYDELKIKIGSTLIATRNGYTSGNVTLDSDEIDLAYGCMQTVNSTTFTFELRTYTSSSKTTQIGSTSSKTATGSISSTGRAPTLSVGNISYQDTDTSIVDITESNDIIIKDYSNLQVNLSNGGSVNKGAILNTYCYSFIVSGHSTQYASNTDTFPINKTFTDCKDNQFIVKITDSRGNYNSYSIDIDTDHFHNYIAPTIESIQAQRTSPDLIGTTVNLTFNGTYDNWNLSTTNTCSTSRYRFKEVGGSYGSWNNISIVWNAGSFSYNANISGTFDAEKAYSFEIEIADLLSSTIDTCNITTITPTMDIDTEKRLTAFGMMGSVDSNGIQATNYYDANGSILCPVGMSFEWNANTIPSGYLLEDGAAISRTDYADLFAVIGTTYGSGDGSTTFNLPNTLGRVIVGFNSSDSDFNSLTDTGGNKNLQSHSHSVSVTVNSNGNHRHGYPVWYTSTSDNDYIVEGWRTKNTQGTHYTNYAGSHNHSASASSGSYGSGSSQNLQPYAVKKRIIKY